MSAVLEAREPSAKYLAARQPPLWQHFELLATAPGGVARLRELILSLAVQGKLMPQDPNDEPASVLLQRIRAEKDRRITEGKIKRDKPLAEIEDDEIPFFLPEGWVWVRLGDVCSYIQRGKSPTYADHSAYKVISQKCVRWYGLDLEPARYITADSLAKYEPVRFLQPDDLLWNSTGTGTIGRACLVPKEHANTQLVADSHVTVVRSLGLDSAFLWRWIQSPYVQNEIEESAAGTTNQIELNTSTVINHLFPLPPLAEQSRITALVEELMRLCDALEAKGQLEAAEHAQLVSTLLGTLTDSATPEELVANWQRIAAHFDLLLDRPEAVDALEQIIFQLAVRGLLVPQDPNDEPASVLLQKIRAEKDRLIAGDKIKRDKPLPAITEEATPFVLPKGWVWARFPELGEFGRGRSKHRPRNDPALFNPPIYPVVQTGEVARANGVIEEYHAKYSEVGLAQSRLWPRGTLCITIAANIADAAVLGFDACFPDSVVGFVPASCIGRADYFLAFMETARSHLVEFAPATAQKNINLEILGALLIPVPPLAEMDRIVARVTEFRRLCAELRHRLAARQITQGHLAQALVETAACSEK